MSVFDGQPNKTSGGLHPWVARLGPALALPVRRQLNADKRIAPDANMLIELVRMPRYAEVDHPPRFQLNNEEDEQLTKQHVDHRYEITHPDVFSMRFQEGRPGLTGLPWRWFLGDVALDRPLGNLDAELEQLATDAPSLERDWLCRLLWPRQRHSYPVALQRQRRRYMDSALNKRRSRFEKSFEAHRQRCLSNNPSKPAENNLRNDPHLDSLFKHQ